MSNAIKVRIDLSTGSVEIEANSDSIEVVFKHLSEFLPRLSDARSRVDDDKDAAVNFLAPSDAPVAASERPSKRSSPNGANRTKETYRVVDIGLTEDDRKNLRAFYEQKGPKSQNEQTAVLMDWLKREKRKATLGKEAIFTAFRTVEAKAPGKISSVLGNMAGPSVGWVVGRGAGEYELTHIAEDHVRLNLPAKKSAK